MIVADRITAATRADLPDVVALVNSAYRGESSRAGWTTEADYIDGQRTSLGDLLTDLSGPGAPVILILRGAGQGALLACGLVETVQTDRGEAGYIGMLTVQPGLQAQGLGRRMLEAAEAEVRRRGVDRARMTVVSIRDSLIAWYERRGYVRTGETLPFPYDDERFGQPRGPGLMFVVLEKAL